MRTTFWGVACGLLLTASSAWAGGGVKGDVELGIYGGYGWLDEHGAFQPKDDMLYGARLGYFLSRHWSFEAVGQRFPTEPDEEVVAPGLSGAEVHFDSYRFNGLYNFGPGERFRPFLTAGAGYEKFDVEGFSESSDLGWNAGAGFRWILTPALNLRADGRYVSTKVDVLDETEHNVEATLGLGFMFGGAGRMAAVAEAPPPLPNRAPTVTCSVERSEILPGESVNVTATASDPEGDPLTYQWSASSGRVTGEATTAAFDFTGATAPASATIRVMVSDNHGNTATSECAVSMAAPKQAEAVSCMAGGFPRNLSRITNVDKACLDDVASRLSADPRATVTIIGYADHGERSAQRLAEQRAGAVRDYLAKERSIEVSRITVRSEGTAAGTVTSENNRRVVVWFVPEGATIPQ